MGANHSPLYVVVAKQLITAIEDGRYAIGELLPTEHELSAELQVSRQTVREAIRRLTEQGLVSRHPGIGTRVLRQHAEVRYSHRMESLSELISYAQDVPLKIHQVEAIEARGELAKMLSCRARTPWLWARGHRRKPNEDTNVTVSDIFVRPDYPGLDYHLLHTPGPVYDMLERLYGEVIEEVRQEIFTVALEPDIAEQLSVSEGAPAMEIHRRFIGKGDRLVMYGRSISPGSRFSYVTTFRRDKDSA